jgi:hypothetical protein
LVAASASTKGTAISRREIYVGAFFLVLPKRRFHLASTRVRNLLEPAVKPLLLPAIYSSRSLLSIAFYNLSRDEETLGLTNGASVPSGIHKTHQPLLDLC